MFQCRSALLSELKLRCKKSRVFSLLFYCLRIKNIRQILLSFQKRVKFHRGFDRHFYTAHIAVAQLPIREYQITFHLGDNARYTLRPWILCYRANADNNRSCWYATSVTSRSGSTGNFAAAVPIVSDR